MVAVLKCIVAFLLFFYIFKINKWYNRKRHIKNRVAQMKRLNKWEEI